MSLYDDALLEEGKRVFKLAALEEMIGTLTIPELQELYPQVPLGDINIWDVLDDDLEPSEPTTTVDPIQNESGELKGFHEILRNPDELSSATISMSLNRAMSSEPSTSIKGSAGNIPFFPGGFDEAFNNVVKFSEENPEIQDEDEKPYLEFKDLLVCAPGFFPEMFEDGSENPQIRPEVKIEDFDKIIGIDDSDIQKVIPENAKAPKFEATMLFEKTGPKPAENEEKQESDVEDSGAEVELPEEKELRVYHLPTETSHQSQTYSFAVEVPSMSDLPEYHQMKDRMAREYPFDLDPFQQAAIVHMENNESVFVAAHTSAGKTVVAEYAIAMCAKHKTKAIYTSPIKALSNQKYRDFKQAFGDVGLITGDIQINSEGFCLIMTTEILQSMLYNGSDVIRDLEWVVFDEVHYINNDERGHVWEEVLIMLPAHVKIVMLSATVPNCLEFADWVGRIKNQTIHVIFTQKRPVPLEHYLYTGQDGKTSKDMFLVLDSNGQWNREGYAKAYEAKMQVEEKKKKQANLDAQYARVDEQAGRGGGRGRGSGPNSQRGRGQDRGRGRGGQQQRGGARGGGQNNPRGGHQNQGSAHERFYKNDKNVYKSLINHLQSSEKLPVVIFVFSRKRCDENAQLLVSTDLTVKEEKYHIKQFFDRCIDRLKGSDKDLPQVIRMRELCMRGFAVHHSGVLPILKEVVELLFQQGYVKVLFATETFAMGVNMPARSVVFDSVRKHDGTAMRALNPGEYIQMAGRAGRRGLDTTGTVIVLCKEMNMPESNELQLVMNGKPQKLESKFRVTYSMLLNLLRVEQLKVEDMLQRSYVESPALREAITKKTLLESAQQRLQNFDDLLCEKCNPPVSGFATIKPKSIQDYHDVLQTFVFTRCQLMPKIFVQPAVDKWMQAGRIVIVSSAAHALQNAPCVFMLHNQNKNMMQVLVPCTTKEDADATLCKKQAEAFWKKSEEEKAWLEETNLLEGTIKFGLYGLNPAYKQEQDKNSMVVYFKFCDIAPECVVGIAKKTLKVDKSDKNDFALEATKYQSGKIRFDQIPEKLYSLVMQIDKVSNEIRDGTIQMYTLSTDIKNAVKELDLSFMIDTVISQENAATSVDYPAKSCENLLEHIRYIRQKCVIEKEVEALKHSLSSSALMLSEDYKNRLNVLKYLDYISDENMVKFKGRVACEIHHQELFITELILSYKLHNRSFAEVAALISSTTCQTKTGNQVKFPKGSIFVELQEICQEQSKKIDEAVKAVKANIVAPRDEIQYELMEVVYEWAMGKPFAEIMEITDCQEGQIVRCIQRLGEVVKDVRNAARIVGDPTLFEKMEEVSAAIKRDIVFAASLYTTE